MDFRDEIVSKSDALYSLAEELDMERSDAEYGAKMARYFAEFPEDAAVPPAPGAVEAAEERAAFLTNAAWKVRQAAHRVRAAAGVEPRRWYDGGPRDGAWDDDPREFVNAAMDAAERG